MNGPTIGSLFTGAGALDLAVEDLLGARTVWQAEIDDGARRVLEHHWPDVANLGDVAAVDWSAADPVDVLTGGFPCQDVSSAGKRAGMRADNRSGLWARMRDAIDVLRPGLVVAENVRGLLSADADSPVEPCPLCLGDRSGRHLRALGAVLGDLADLGYDTAWCGLRASDVGACHHRFRVFILAWPVVADPDRDPLWTQPGGIGGGGDTAVAGHAGAHQGAADTDGVGSVRGGRTRRRGPRSTDDRVDAAHAAVEGLEGAEPGSLPGLPGRCGGTAADPDDDGCAWHPLRDGEPQRPELDGTHRLDAGRCAAADTEGHGRHARWAEPARQLGGSDAAVGGDAATADPSGCGEQDQPHGRHSVGLAVGPVAGPGAGDRPGGTAEGVQQLGADAEVVAWGDYAAAIARWERIIGRRAPAPTLVGRRGSRQLNPAFSEWMMGWPQGWVTAVQGLTRATQLAIIGNGVVPQQAAAAISWLLARRDQERAA